MLSGILASCFLLLSSNVYSVDAQQGDDMSDEDYRIYVEEHYELFESANQFMVDHKDIIIRGGVGGLVGTALKNVVTKNPTVAGIIIGSGVELVKEIYKEIRAEDEENDLELRMIHLENHMWELQTEMKNVDEKYVAFYERRLQEEYRRCHEEDRIRREIERRDREEKERVWKESIKVSDARDAGPYRESFREYREPSTREIRDTIDRIVKDSTSDRDWVRRRD